MIITRLMDIITREGPGKYTRNVLAFENAAQVDSMRDILLAQDKACAWQVLGPSLGDGLGVWEILYGGQHMWMPTFGDETERLGIA